MGAKLNCVKIIALLFSNGLEWNVIEFRVSIQNTLNGALYGVAIQFLSILMDPKYFSADRRFEVGLWFLEFLLLPKVPYLKQLVLQDPPQDPSFRIIIN